MFLSLRQSPVLPYPAQTFYDNVSVKQVDVNSTTGAFGILPNHVPSIALLKPGLVTVYEGDKTQKFFCESKYSRVSSAFYILFLEGRYFSSLLLCFCTSISHLASSGTVTINADSTVQILAEDAYPLDMLDAQV